MGRLIAVMTVVALMGAVPAAGATEQCPVAPDPGTEIYLLAHLIAGEAQNCDDTEQRYVASVALNRVADSRFPDTLEEVIYQPGQFACTWDGNYDREPTESNWANAAYVLENGPQLPADVVWQAAFEQGSYVYCRTQWHVYCGG